MSPADLFAYLAAFITIVVAVALTDLIQSTHRLLRARNRVRWDLLALLPAAYVYLSLLSEFFTLWDELRVDHLTYYSLVLEMAVPTLVALAAFAVLPDEVPDAGIDLGAFYFLERRYLVVLFALAQLGDEVRNLAWLGRHGYLWRWEVWAWLGSLTVAAVLILTTMWIAKSRRIQLIALIGLLVFANVGYFQWSVQAKHNPATSGL